jgi:hypothetical protein
VEPSTPQPVGTSKGKGAAAAASEAEEDSDGDYVYDTYVRLPLRPAAPHDHPSDTDTPANLALPSTPNNIDPSRKDIGVVVISKEDEDIWEEYAEDEQEEENWDGDDVDSNGRYPIPIK